MTEELTTITTTQDPRTSPLTQLLLQKQKSLVVGLLLPQPLTRIAELLTYALTHNSENYRSDTTAAAAETTRCLLLHEEVINQSFLPIRFRHSMTMKGRWWPVFQRIRVRPFGTAVLDSTTMWI